MNTPLQNGLLDQIHWIANSSLVHVNVNLLKIMPCKIVLTLPVCRIFLRMNRISDLVRYPLSDLVRYPLSDLLVRPVNLCLDIRLILYPVLPLCLQPIQI